MSQPNSGVGRLALGTPVPGPCEDSHNYTLPLSQITFCTTGPRHGSPRNPPTARMMKSLALDLNSDQFQNRLEPNRTRSYKFGIVSQIQFEIHSARCYRNRIYFAIYKNLFLQRLNLKLGGMSVRATRRASGRPSGTSFGHRKHLCLAKRRET